jgi:hypothetical protein
MALTRKRLLLIGFILILLIGIPVTLFVIQQQQEIRSRAEKSTTLYYQPETSQAAPLQKAVGDTFSLDIFADPGTNLISAIRLEIDYDPDKLATASATGNEPAFVPDPQALPNILFGPVYTPGKIQVTISAGADPTNVVDTVSKIGTVTFSALGATAGSVTQVTYGVDTLVTSAGQESQFAENVLSSTSPAFIEITDADVPSTTPTTAPSIAPTRIPTAVPTAIPTPTDIPETTDSPDEPTPVFTEAPTDVPTEAPTAAPTTDAGQSGNTGNTANPPTATPTLAPTGPGDVMLGFGAVLAVLTILGGILFFAL